MDVIVTVIIIAALGYAAWKFWPKADVNKDGKVDADDAVEVVKKTTTRAKKVVDKNATKIASRSKKVEK